MQVVDTVNISIHPEGMREILVQLNKLKNEVNRIETEFVRIGRSLDPEFLEISKLVRSVEQDLVDINVSLARFCSFVDNTINEYVDADKRIKGMVDNIQNLISTTRDKFIPIKSIDFEKKNQKVFYFDMLKIDLIDEPCRLPRKEILEKFKVRPGKIAEGKNILVRTWSSSIN